jgi:hypothetical protein
VISTGAFCWRMIAGVEKLDDAAANLELPSAMTAALAAAPAAVVVVLPTNRRREIDVLMVNPYSRNMQSNGVWSALQHMSNRSWTIVIAVAQFIDRLFGAADCERHAISPLHRGARPDVL